MKPQRQRAERGSVQVKQRGDRLQICLTFQGRKIRKSIGLNTPLNICTAKKIAAQIEQDLIVGTFDPTLDKYFPTAIASTDDQKPQTTAELFQQFIDYRRQTGTSGQALSTRYVIPNRVLSRNLGRIAMPYSTNSNESS